MKLFLVLALCSSLSLSVMACTEDGGTGFVPENDMYIPVGDKVLGGGLSEKQFNAVIDKISDIYTPVASSMRGNLKIARKWSDGTVNANAMRLGSLWNVNMYGGLARHKSITEDGFALVLCHEIGHHIGGAPKKNGFIPILGWASNEGQADYWATLKCLRHVFLNDDNAKVISTMKVPATLAKACGADKSAAERDLCIRTGMAGLSVTEMFVNLGRVSEARFETPDPKVVSRTNDSHPKAQCRLDTFLAGSICEKSYTEDVSQSDEVVGTCHRTTGSTLGVRPACWFKSK
jgi:hypothetical protein